MILSVKPVSSLPLPQVLTKQEAIYRTLRAGILDLTFPPGQKLVIDQLARQYQVSAIPIREALRLLEAEGLITNQPHTGSVVAPISEDSIAEVFALLEGLESVCAQRAVERVTEESLAELEAMVSDMERSAVSSKPEVWAEKNQLFHLRLAQLPGFPMLEQHLLSVLDQWGRIRRYFFNEVMTSGSKEAQRDHRAILTALKRRQPDRLSEILREHNRRAAQLYLQALAQQD